MSASLALLSNLMIKYIIVIKWNQFPFKCSYRGVQVMSWVSSQMSAHRLLLWNSCFSLSERSSALIVIIPTLSGLSEYPRSLWNAFSVQLSEPSFLVKISDFCPDSVSIIAHCWNLCLKSSERAPLFIL